MSARYRVAIVASGRIAREHASGWQACEHTEIVAIADSHPQALDVFGNDFNVAKPILIIAKCWKKSAPILLASAPGIRMHAEMTIAAAPSPQSHALEKPMAVSLGRGRCHDDRLSTQRCQIGRWPSTAFLFLWVEAKRLVQEGEIGKPVRIWSSRVPG